MKRVVLAVAAVGLVLLIGAWASAAPEEKVKPGEQVALSLVNIHDETVPIPRPGARYIHLQFHRYAGCPICNLTLQPYLKRDAELKAAGIQEVVVFHSPKEHLLPYQGRFPFDVVADPERKLYARFGVGTSVFALLDVRSWPAIVQGHSLPDGPHSDPEDTALGRPADFLLTSDGRVVASHYGRHAADTWTVDQVKALAR